MDTADEPDSGDWRRYVDLARALIAQRRIQEAVVAARQAVALAPDEPEAHLALADALLAVFPRRIRIRAAARAHVDRAELLGVDRRELADRRNAPKSLGFVVVYWVCWWLFWIFGVQHQEGAIGVAIAWPAMILAFTAMILALLRPPGRSLKETLDVKRQIARKRLEEDDLVPQRAPGAAAFLGFLTLPSVFLAIPGVDSNRPAPVAAWLVLCGIPLAGLAVWIGVDRWLRPGTVMRTLLREPYVAVSVTVTFILAMTTAAAAVRRVESPGLWFALFLGQAGWIIGNGICGGLLVSRRNKAAED